MRTCPKCGAVATDEDLFCENDGVKLQGSVAPPPAVASAARGRACSACGLADADSGDGYCSACGHRLDRMSTVPPLPIGASVLGHEIVLPRGDDDYVVKSKTGQVLVLTLGAATDLALEADALARIPQGSVFPGVVERGEDPERGPALVLTPVRGKRLADVVRAMPLRALVAWLRGIVDAAAAVVKAGVTWIPRVSDLYVDDVGQLAVSRLRCAAGAAAASDLRPLLETVGGIVLPLPAALGPPRLARLLLPASPALARPLLTRELAHEELARIEAELEPPKEAAPGLAELVDPGLRRDHNEDATAVAAGDRSGDPWAVLVVCDGVSSSTHAEQASTIASRTTRDALAHFLRSGDVAFEGLPSAMSAAIRAAHVAVCATPIPRGSGEEGSPGPPGTTIVAAIVFKRRIVVGWVGDSRAYWVTSSGAELLTRDHSWVNEIVAKGEMTEAEAMVAPLAHALTRCLGPLEVGEGKIEEIEPEVRVRDLAGPGDVVLCTDGLWNYYPQATDVASVVRAAGTGASAPVIARCLVNHALSQGGGDNVSVAVYRHK